MTLENYLPTLFQQYIYLSRYARWLPEQNRRETWEETVKRYFDFFQDHLATNYSHDISDYRKELEDAVLTLKVMPSMRALMTAGEALKRENMAGYNCLAGETNVITKEYGMMNIASLLDKEVSVLNPDGGWSKTKVKEYGQQSLSKIRFRYASNKTEDVFATDHHDWILEDGKRIQTRDLKMGMKIPYVQYKRLPVYNCIDYKLGIIHGLIYGDGTQIKYKMTPQDKKVISQERNKGYMIRLCSDQKDLLPYFEGYNISYPPSFGGDPIIYLYDNFAKTHLLKELPIIDETDEYMIGFFRGWLAADGSVGKNGNVAICVGSKEEKWLKNVMPKYGIYFQSTGVLPKITNYGTRKKDSRNLKIWRASLSKDDFIIERKKDRFIPLSIIRTIKDVQKTNRIETVYCVEVPVYRSFVIENGILTGNCGFLAINRPQAFDEILYGLMNGTGIGFSVESKEVSQLPTIAETFHHSDTTIVVADSKLGWAKALKEFIGMLYVGQIPCWDVSKVRPAGAPLKTFGGRASGPAPLVSLFQFCIDVFKRAAGRKLTTLECHDIVCKIADVVVVGGVRRCCKNTYLINTIDGWKQIDKLTLSDKVKINGDEYAIKNIFDNGMQETVNIKMKDGTTHICTKEHKWYVYNHNTTELEWKTSEELKNGRYSMLRPKVLSDV